MATPWVGKLTSSDSALKGQINLTKDNSLVYKAKPSKSSKEKID